MPHPFLKKDFEIKWGSLTPDAIESDLQKALIEAQREIDAIASRLKKDSPLTYANTIAALDSATDTLNHAWGLVSHLDSVSNSPELRKAHNTMLPAVTEFYARIPLNPELWNVLKTFEKSAAAAALSSTKRRHLNETLADFKEQGADLPPTQKARAAEIQKRLAAITQKYSENCLDATNAWEKIISDRQMLSGLPESALSAAKQDAEQKGHPNAWRFTLQAPSLISILTYADNNELRKEIWQAYNSIGREGKYDNRELVREILTLRHALAQLMGQANFADHVTARRMAGSGNSALQFGNAIFDKIEAQFQTEAQALRQYKATETESAIDLLEPWETGYWAEKQRLANYDFDEEALRPYFSIDRVIEGLFEITQKLFGLRIEACETVETWHEEVKYYKLFDAKTNEQLGAFYADWHPRESKRGGAWMNYLITGNRDENTGPRTPHLGLICGNLTPAVGAQVALLTHREVETIFHEFGHLLHHLCGEVEVKALNGVNVPWDFVELPSQILENWCWNRESLDLFARHYETGAAIPPALFDKMLAARNYMKASANVRQLSFGKMDLELHIHWGESTEDDLDAFIKECLKDYTPAHKTETKSNIYNFSHLFSSPTGYAAGYYSYKWAEVLDADAFTRFQNEGILNPLTGHDFRHEILAKGNSEDPAQLFRNFMNRAPDPDALLRRDGLLPAACAD
jgi:oligopeptidase A